MDSSGSNSSADGRDETPAPTESERIIAAIKKAGVEAVSLHKKLGNPIAVWRDGKVVILQPDEIPDPS